MVYIKYCCLFSIIIIFTGCMPYHLTEQPGVSGQTVDSETNISLQNVTVRLEYASENIDTTDKIILTTKTSEEGTFHIAPKRKWGIYIVPTDFFPIPYSLVFIKENYITQTITFAHSMGEKQDTVDIGTVQLERKSN